mmetsp:Transcript_15779/g.39105  ORF Transcript_15779/g.39105 Transcript_15779/m.39105 type:complete len:208 (-) Transcript_15779:161-784(-)
MAASSSSVSSKSSSSMSTSLRSASSWSKPSSDISWSGSATAAAAPAARLSARCSAASASNNSWLSFCRFAWPPSPSSAMSSVTGPPTPRAAWAAPSRAACGETLACGVASALLLGSSASSYDSSISSLSSLIARITCGTRLLGVRTWLPASIGLSISSSVQWAYAISLACAATMRVRSYLFTPASSAWSTRLFETFRLFRPSAPQPS